MTIAASVIIPTYNQSKSLSLCLDSLFQQTADPDCYEIIVTDDGSTDDTPDMIREMKAKAPCRFQYIWHENLGRSFNRNTGAKAAAGQYLIFLDGDMIVKPEFVEAHLAGHKTPDSIVNGTFVNVTTLNPADWPKKVRDLSRAFFATGNVSVEREKFLAAGLFDEDFVEYGWEDLELGIRLKQMGLRSVKSRLACSYHLQHPITPDNIEKMIKKEKERGHTAVLFYRKHPTFEVRLMTLIMPLFFILDKMFSLFHWPERPGTLRFLKQLQSRGGGLRYDILVALIKNHAYADGIKEELARNPLKKKSINVRRS